MAILEAIMLSSRCVSFVFGMWWCTSLLTPLPPAHIHNTVQMARIVMLLYRRHSKSERMIFH